MEIANSKLTQATLCVILNESKKEILLGMKKKDLFGGGKYNGPGGKVKDDETIERAALRELTEESGLTAKLSDLIKIGEFTFIFPESQAKFNQIVHVYFVTRWQGVINDSDEMIWKWFSLSNIPYDQMWDDDKYWLPKALEDKRLKGAFYFNEKRKVERKELSEVKYF